VRRVVRPAQAARRAVAVVAVQRVALAQVA
jgi:hypothetical protein